MKRVYEWTTECKTFFPKLIDFDDEKFFCEWEQSSKLQIDLKPDAAQPLMNLINVFFYSVL